MSAPLASTDAGMLRKLAVGPYTATLSSTGTNGLAIIELNAIDGCNGTAKLMNISTRAAIRGGIGDV
ncbi:hypothetical protein QUF54_03760, partial [Candidatus Marithioploca araucensis]|nr:hypothetical protein [Candidatus Marithioploca araucensis]